MAKFKVPNTYVIVFSIIIISAILTWVLPGGEYVTQEDGTTRFQSIDAQPQTWQIFSALYEGFIQQAGIIVFVLIIGGTFWIINTTKAIDQGIISFIKATKSIENISFFRKIGVGNIVIVAVMLLFGLFGAVFGMSEETIAFAAILVPLAISLGYDSITGVCMVYVAAHVGFAGAMLNPFTIGIAQEMSGLPLFSGVMYRTLCWLIFMIVAIVCVLLYAGKIKKKPSLSPMFEADDFWRKASAHADDQEEESVPISKTPAIVTFVSVAMALLLFTIFYYDSTYMVVGNADFRAPYLLPIVFVLYILSSIISIVKSVKGFILNNLIFSIIYLIIGVLCFKWYLTEIAAMFFALGLASGFASGYGADRLVKEFLSGAKDIFSAALVIGLATGIIYILREGKVLDTILCTFVSLLDGSGKAGAVSTMYGIQTVINLFIPSATAKAAITMPIMAPFSDLIDISRQTTVLAFQFGDGITNMITPCSGVLLAVLSIAKIPYSIWVKWVWKFILLMIVLGLILLLPTIYCDIPGF